LKPVRSAQARIITWLWAMFWIHLVLAAGTVALVLDARDVIDAGINPNDVIILIIHAAVGFILFALAMAVSFLIWQYRVHCNAQTISSSEFSVSAGVAVICWMVPGLNLVQPVLTIRDIDRATSPPGGLIARTIMYWWTLVIAGVVIRALGLFSLTASHGLAPAIALVVASANSAVAIVLLIRIIRSISDRQAAWTGE
jgi:hypothetical protein